MKWHAQVLHVAAKDMRLAKWSLVLYAVAVAIITVNVLYTLGLWIPMLWVGAVCVIGAVIVALMVHADSPSRVDAFWATRPLSPHAVYAAKLVGVALIVALPMAGELAALLAHDVSVGIAAALLARPTAVYISLLATAIMVAVLTPDIRFFVAAFAALFIALTLGAQLLPWWLKSGAPTVPVPVLYAVAIGGMFALGAFQYHTRAPRRGMVFAVLLVLLTMMLPMRMLARVRWPVPPAVTAAIDSARLSLQVEALREVAGHWVLPLRVGIEGGSREQHYALYVTEVMVVAGDEREFLPLPPGSPSSAIDFKVHGGYRALNERMPLTYAGIPVTGSMRELMLRQDARIVVRARITVSATRTIAELPLGARGAVAARGRRLRVMEMSHTPAIELRVHDSMVPPVAFEAGYALEERFQLVNPARGEAILLTIHHENADYGALVLPASHSLTRSIRLTPMRSGLVTHPLNIEDSWFADAVLQLITTPPAGEYMTTAEAPIPRT